MSRISLSAVTRPLRSGRVSSSSTVRSSLVTLPLYANPARPDCHGMESRFSVSKDRSSSDDSRLARTFGMFAGSSFWIQPSRLIRAAIQSVSTMMSRSVLWQAASWCCTLPKNSLLSLMSSV